MSDATDLLNVIKRAAVEAVENGEPTDFCFGKVTSEKPLKIMVEQKMELGKNQLILSRNVTEFKTEVTIKWHTEDALGSQSHNHEINGKKEIRVHNQLKKGEKVILLKQKGGQKYLVLDRVVIPK